MQYFTASEEILKVHSANMWIGRRLMVGQATVVSGVGAQCSTPRRPFAGPYEGGCLRAPAEGMVITNHASTRVNVVSHDETVTCLPTAFPIVVPF